MTKYMYAKVLSAVVALGLPAGVCAQKNKVDTTHSKVVVVENEYHPEVMDANKINRLPALNDAPVQPKSIEYLTNPTLFQKWIFEPVAAMTDKVEQPKPERFYARLGYGLRNNVDARLASALRWADKNQLQISLSANGFSGKLDDAVAHPELTSVNKWDAYAYRFTGGLDYVHRFNRVSVGVGANAQFNTFNYMPKSHDEAEQDKALDHQNYGLYDFYASLASVGNGLPYDFRLKLGATIFNRYVKTERQLKGYQMDYYAQGFLAKPIDDRNTIQINFRGDYLYYDMYHMDLSRYKNYLLLRFNPYFEHKGEKVLWRLGAHSNVQLGFRNRYYIAPDIKVDWTLFDRYTLFLHADGGTVLNDEARLSELSIYGVTPTQLNSTYIPYDLSGGVKMSPLTGLGIQLSANYTSYRNRVFMLPSEAELMPIPYSGKYTPVELLQADTRVLRFHLGSAYDYKDRMHFGLKANYYRWYDDSNVPYYYFLTPEWDLKLEARAKLMMGFSLTADYTFGQYQKVEKFKRTSPVNLLNVGAEYNGFKQATVFVHFKNLLNQKFFYTNVYPEQRFYALAGISVKF